MMYSFRADSGKAELRGKTEYGETVVVELAANDKPGTYDVTLTLAGRAPKRYLLLARDTDFVGNKVQLKGPFLRIVVDPDTAERFHAFLQDAEEGRQS